MNYRRSLIRVVTFLGGIYFFLEFVLPATIAGVEFGKYHSQISNGFIAIGTMAVGLGIIKLLMVHGSRMVFRRPGWPNSFALLASLFVMMIVTSLDWRETYQIASDADELAHLRDFGEVILKDDAEGTARQTLLERGALLSKAAREALLRTELRLNKVRDLFETIPAEEGAKLESDVDSLVRGVREGKQTLGFLDATVLANDSAAAREQIESVSARLAAVSSGYREVQNDAYKYSFSSKLYRFFFEGLFVALGSAMFSLLGFYIASEAYRAFRIRTAESTFMLLAAVAVMLGQIPFGIWIWEGFPELRNWLLSVPNSGAFRAIRIGAAVAGLVMAFRMWFSIESEYVKEEQA